MSSYLTMCANSKEYQEYLAQKEKGKTCNKEEKPATNDINSHKETLILNSPTKQEAKQYLEGIDEATTKEQRIEKKKEITEDDWKVVEARVKDTPKKLFKEYGIGMLGKKEEDDDMVKLKSEE